MLALTRPLLRRPPTVHAPQTRRTKTQGLPLPLRPLAMPRMVQRRWQAADAWAADICAAETVTDPLHEARVAWARARQSRIRVDPALLNRASSVTDTTLERPWRIVRVPPAAIRWLREADFSLEPHSFALWRIGRNRPAAHCNPVDIDGSALQQQLQTRRPAQGRFTEVAKGLYGDRYAKYLFVIDHQGMHIVREMTPCDLSSRGIALHSLMREKAVLGGEIFFDADDPGKVWINFGSARFPVESNYQAEKAAEFVLALGYHTVLAMIPDRDLRQGEYGMADRYGKGVHNMLFCIDDKP